MVDRIKVPDAVHFALGNLASAGRTRKQALSITFDFCVVAFSLWAAFSLRTGQTHVDFAHTLHLFLILPPLAVMLFASLGIYRWKVRSSNSRLYAQLIKGSAGSGLILLVIMYLLPPGELNPRSLFVIFALLLISGTCGSRMVWKFFFDSGRKGMPIAIYGAGSAGEQLAASLVTGTDYRPVCFIDDAPELKGATIQGIPVFQGYAENLEEQLLRREVSQIIIAIPSLKASEYEGVVDRLEVIGLPFRTLPSFAELVSGQAEANDIREISVHDILGRNEVVPDPALLGLCIKGKSVLVTGGGGSIGSELCRQIVKLEPSRLVVVDNSESNLYHITEEVTSLLAEDKGLSLIDFEAVLCSVTDARRVARLFETSDFNTVYHAAAYKHVPIVEKFPEQGAEVNIFGTLNVLNSAIAAKVDNFVLISSDKAVRPTNAMGATKRIAELILQAKAKQSPGTLISMVRFGNVLASTGSVVPKFRKQIEAGGPVTITDPSITRYFMTIPEASQLVLQASAISRGGDVFVLDMGEPVLIAHLAETMIRLYRRSVSEAGRVPPQITTKVIGLRPGEKMYEELFIDSSCQETSVEKIMTASENFLEWNELSPLLHELHEGLYAENRELIKQTLRGLVWHADQGLPSSFHTAVVTEIAEASPVAAKSELRVSG